MAPRTYDVSEANRVLPEVRRLVERIVEASAELPDLQDQLRIEEYRLGRPGAGREAAAGLEAAADALRGAEDGLADAVGRLQAMGVQLKDARTGLVDFLAYREGELVELCWRLGEPEVGHWHRIGEGFPGRKEL